MEFLEVSKKLTYRELSSVENELHVLFTDNFKEHYVKYNGGYPLKRYYMWPNGAKTRINHFYSIKYPGFTQLEDVYDDLFITEKILPVGYIPFASDDGANFFCISTLSDKYNEVFFCDMYHYDPDIIENYFTLIAPSFKEFIDNLTNK